jgi:hypothetical protein
VIDCEYIPTDAKCSYNRCHFVPTDAYKIHTTDVTLISVRNYFYIDRTCSQVASLFKIMTRNKIPVILFGWAGVVIMVTRLLDGQMGIVV